MPISPLPDHVDALHREVQRKFGRNLLRLQQYERLIKALVAEHDVTVTSDDFASARAARHESVATKTLGQVIGELTGTFIAPASDSPHPNDNEDPPGDLNKSWFRITNRIEFAEGNFQQVKQKLADVVDLRNELVHHFLEKHDIWSEPGCVAADAYLDECYKLIDSSFAEVSQWAKSSTQRKASMANWLNSPEGTDFIVHGILPGKAGVNWAASTIVNFLRDAEKSLAQDGWTSLTSAIAYISEREPEHTPNRYGCSSWPHVLHASKLFDIRKERNEGLPTETWYRSSPDAASN